MTTQTLRVVEHPYSRLFFLKNRDPSNYVLSRDFFFYSIVALYLFLLWYYALVFKNYNFLSRTDEGNSVWYLTLFSSVILLMVFSLSYLSPVKSIGNSIYPLLGLGYSLLLVSMIVLIYHFDKNEIDRGFEYDPVQISFAFLSTYSFVSFFLI
jgi:hypothetical protein